MSDITKKSLTEIIRLIRKKEIELQRKAGKELWKDLANFRGNILLQPVLRNLTSLRCLRTQKT